MKIIQLEYFCAVCRYHSITQAAQKLYVTQPAISNAIKELEKEFSINLFTRSKNHMELTKEGEIFYQKQADFSTQLVRPLPNSMILVNIFHLSVLEFHHC